MHVYRITSKYHRFNINSFFLVRYFYIFVCFLHSISVSVRMPTSNFVSFSFFFDRYFCNCARTNDGRVPPVLFHLLWPMCKMCIFFLIFFAEKRISLLEILKCIFQYAIFCIRFSNITYICRPFRFGYFIFIYLSWVQDQSAVRFCVHTFECNAELALGVHLKMVFDLESVLSVGVSGIVYCARGHSTHAEMRNFRSSEWNSDTISVAVCTSEKDVHLGYEVR